MREKVLEILEEINDEVLTYTGDNFIEDDILDSLSVIDLVAELEETFDIEINPKYIVEDNFKSVDTILTLLEQVSK